ncbi:hypothetical protein D3C74_445210 [compost metagenome]
MVYVIKRLLGEIFIKCGTAKCNPKLLIGHFREYQQMAEIGQEALIERYRFLILFGYQLRQRMPIQE